MKSLGCRVKSPAVSSEIPREIERTLPKKAPIVATVFFVCSISLSLSLSLSWVGGPYPKEEWKGEWWGPGGARRGESGAGGAGWEGEMVGFELLMLLN